MYVLKENLESILEIKKSKFLTKIYKIDNFDEINSILDKLREEFKDATHICYAYRYEDKIKCSDDGEPGGTAGLPILQILDRQELDHTLAVVIRYFGGIKLGAGGLVRAYSNAVRECLDKKEIQVLVKGYKIQINTTYEKTKQLDYILRNNQNIKKEYQEEVIYTFKVEKEELINLQDYNPKIIEECLIEKEI